MVVVTRIRFDKRGLGVLSPLEEDVLKVLWRDEKGYRVRDIYGIIRKRKRTAITSVAVILDRLYQKRIVTRKIKTGRGGEHYIYSCFFDKRNFQQSIVEKTVNTLIDKFGDVAVNYFNERFAKKKKKRWLNG